MLDFLHVLHFVLIGQYLQNARKLSQNKCTLIVTSSDGETKVKLQTMSLVFRWILANNEGWHWQTDTRLMQTTTLTDR